MGKLVRVSVIASLVGLSSSFAFAGHFEAVGNTSGLTFTSQSNSVPTFGVGSASGTCGGGSGSCSIGGTLTTTYKWKKDVVGGVELAGDVAPLGVIVIESSTVTTDAKSFYGSGYATPTGSSVNGMGTDWSKNPAATTTVLVAGGGGYWVPIGTEVKSSSTGTKAQVMGVTAAAGGNAATFTVTCSPSSSASAGNGTVSTTINYSLAFNPVTVSVAGTLAMADSSLEILPGQQAVGTLGIGGQNVSVDAATWQWGVSGDTFNTYVASASAGTLTYMQTADWKVGNPAWRWTSEVNDTVTCSAKVDYAPDGFASKEFGTATGSKLVTVKEAKGTLTATVRGDGHGQILQTPDLTSKPSIGGDAVVMTYKAPTDADFVPTQGYGSIGYIQLLDNTNYIASTATTNYLINTSIKTTTPPDRLPTIAVDNGYPYPFGDGYVLADDNSSGGAQDSPHLGYNPALYISLNTNLTAKGYILFKAPGATSQPVPCQRFEFTWIASATKNGSGVWVESVDPTTGVISNTTTKTVAETKAYIHPEWTHIFTNIG
jgi:hypothetical protein